MEVGLHNDKRDPKGRNQEQVIAYNHFYRKARDEYGKAKKVSNEGGDEMKPEDSHDLADFMAVVQTGWTRRSLGKRPLVYGSSREYSSSILFLVLFSTLLVKRCRLN